MQNCSIIQHPQHHFTRSGGLCVVLLDDSEFDRRKLTRMIRQKGDTIEVIPCADMVEFRDVLTRATIDICLVDNQLENASGVDAVAALKARPDMENVPVLMISGREDPKTIVASMKAGCADYLGKQTLTATKLHNAILDAISEVFAEPDLSRQIKGATDKVIKGISRECSTTLKPRLHRMYRQIAFIRACHAHGMLPSPEALDDVEDQCLAIWRFFDGIDAYGEGLIATRH